MKNINDISIGEEVKIKLDSWGYCEKQHSLINYVGSLTGKILEIDEKNNGVFVYLPEQKQTLKYSLRDILD
jgi:hypothetical protein